MLNSLIGAALALALAGAQGGAVSAQATDPAKLKLAAEVTEATGGQARVDEMMRGMFAGMREVAASVSPHGQSGFVEAMQSDFETQFRAMTPQLLAMSQEAYARELTTQELTDLLAWLRSPSGRAISAKTPVIQQDLMRAQLPILKAAMPRLLRSSIAHACDVQHCTAEQRAAINAALAKAFPAPPTV